MAKAGNDQETTADFLANEWGLPDWRDAASYGDCENWNLLRWRWEFTRRRDDYRKDFDAHEQTESEACRFFPHTGEWKTDFFEKHEVGFAAETCPNLLQKYKMLQMPNPRFSAQPMDLIFCLEYPGGHTSFYQGTQKSADGEPCSPALEENEAAVVFDLNEPLSDQLNAARRFLERAQVKLHGSKLQKRRHTSKWLTYLRVLDARESGARWAMITDILPNTARQEQTARDIWKQANALRFNF